LEQSGADTLLKFDADGSGGTAQTALTIAVLKGVDASRITSSNFYPMFGTPNNDVLDGTPASEKIYGIGGNDSLDGGGGDDTVDGGDGNDYVEGGAGDDEVIGGAGSDTLDGGEGEDCAEYADQIIGIFLSLVDGMAKGNESDVQLWTDKLIAIENACGGAGDDQIFGNAGSNKLGGREGNDTLNGGAGFDYVEYEEVKNGVLVDLKNGTAQDGFGTTDQLSSIEGIIASAFNDQLIGDARMNKFWGMEGNDTIDGGEGYDEAFYHGAISEYKIEQLTDGKWRVTDNRKAGKDVELDGIDVLSNIEKLVFSDTTKALSDLSVNQSGSQTIKGQVYAWKNHVLLSDVQLALTQLNSTGPTKAQIFEFKNLQKTASGDYEAELWVNLGTGGGSLDLNLQFDKSVSLSFAENLSALPSGWSLISGSEGGTWSMGAMGLTNAKGNINLGKMTFDLPAGIAGGAISIVDGSAGDVSQSAYVLQLGAGGSFQTATGSDGQFSWTNLGAGTYSVVGAKSLTSLETGGAISSADALAALKIAVGRNPNLDGAAISPYQLIAADVTQDGKVTSADALAILKMAVKRNDAPLREWFFVNESQDFWDEAANGGQGGLTISRTNVAWNKDVQATVTKDTTVNLLAVLKGDVNGSWADPSSSKQSLPNSYFTDLVNKGLGPLSTWGVVMA
jgi:Ca2+-binding RTX toxin-like protein